MALKERALRRLADKLNAAGVCWGVGAGWLLAHHGVLDGYHDLDILVAEADTERADRILSRLGMRAPAEADGFRCGYHFDGADVDVSAGMVLGGRYHARFDGASIAGEAEVLGARVALMHLEDWYVYYALMGRESRVAALERYFAAHPPARPERFSQAVAEPLPDALQAKINAITGGNL